MNQFVSEATDATFEQEVIQRSYEKPVLVDFWAEWCGPCKMLGPVLEQAVAARDGAVHLVKVDTDQHQQVAGQLGVRGIPAVKAFVDGQLVDEFVGALDRRGVEAFIERLQPAPADQALAGAEQLLSGERAGEVAAALEPALQSPAHRDRALLLLARAHYALAQVAQAEQALEQIDDGTPEAEAAVLLRTQGELMGAASGKGVAELEQAVDRNPDAPEQRWALAGALLRDGRTAEALEQLLQLVQRDRSFQDDGARRAMLAVFDALGPDSELARGFRRQLQIYT